MVSFDPTNENTNTFAKLESTNLSYKYSIRSAQIVIQFFPYFTEAKRQNELRLI
jgi:hypothetical protein